MRTIRVLLVDDNPDNREIIGVFLGQKYEVFSYASAAEALAALPAVRPDVLALDIRMRPLDGVECLGAIRAIPGYATIPAIAVTAYAREVEQKEFLDAGFQAVVTKPIVDDRELVAAIEGVLRAGDAAGAPS